MIVLVVVMALVSEMAIVVMRIWVVLVWFCCSNRTLRGCGGHPKASLLNHDKYVSKE